MQCYLWYWAQELSWPSPYFSGFQHFAFFYLSQHTCAIRGFSIGTWLSTIGQRLNGRWMIVWFENGSPLLQANSDMDRLGRSVPIPFLKILLRSFDFTSKVTYVLLLSLWASHDPVFSRTTPFEVSEIYSGTYLPGTCYSCTSYASECRLLLIPFHHHPCAPARPLIAPKHPGITRSSLSELSANYSPWIFGASA